MARYKVLTDFAVSVGQEAVAGDVVDLDPKVAAQYVQQGRLVPAPPEPAKKAAKPAEDDGPAHTTHTTGSGR